MADYSINAVTRRVVFTGSAGTGPYAFTFEVISQTDLAVYFNATKLTLTTDYTVTINANGTGSVTIVVGTNVPSTPTASDTITIIGARDIERTTDFVTAGDLLASALNEQLDSQIIMIQQLAEENKRTLRAPAYDPAAVEDGGTLNMALPAKATRATKVLGFDASGNPVASTSTLAEIEADAAAAAASASAAATSASNAASSASGAASSASAASTSASNAAASESNASTSASSASSSASSASSSASSASTSASNASTSASNAATSESNAATSESNAATSASNASSSASAAASSASSAATSYDNFDDRYLGAKSSDPALDNDGDALITGALYFNTTAGSMKVYDGASWLDGYLGVTVTNISDQANSSTGWLDLPVGTTAQRGSPTSGAVRYNTDDSAFEGYNGSVWGALGGGVSGPGSSTDNAVVRFDGAGGATIQNSGVIVDDSDNITGVTSINGGQLAGFRNKIINGNGVIAQRSSSASSISSSGYHFADRWRYGVVGTGVVTLGVVSSYIEVDVTTADASIAASDSYALQYRIEANNISDFLLGTANAKEVTLSFKHKHTKTGTYCVGFRNSAFDRSYVAEYTQSASNTEETATITLTLDTSGTWSTGTNSGLQVDFVIAQGSDFQTTAGAWTAGNYTSTSNQVNALDSTSNYFRITDVQLEIGDTATPFEQRGIGTELALCQRYYSKSYFLTTAPGTATTTGVIGIQTESFTGNGTGTTTIFMPVDMRTSATITIYDPNSTNSTGEVGKVGGGSQAINAPASSHRCFYFSLTAASSNSQYYAHYTASAEL